MESTPGTAEPRGTSSQPKGQGSFALTSYALKPTKYSGANALKSMASQQKYGGSEINPCELVFKFGSIGKIFQETTVLISYQNN